jgi:hypothetical protein
MLPGAAQAVEDSTLLRKRAALAGFYRFHARRDPRVPAVLGELIGTRPTGSYVRMLAHARRAAPDSFSLLARWLTADRERLTASLLAHIGHPAYGPDALRADLDRFAFLLGGNDGEFLTGEEPP